MHFHFPWIVEIHHCTSEGGKKERGEGKKKKKLPCAVELTIKVARRRNKTDPWWRKMRDRKQQNEGSGMKREDGWRRIEIEKEKKEREKENSRER